MILAAQDIRSARLAVERVLDDVGLRAYLYSVEPRERSWALRVEFPAGENWQEAMLPVDPEELRASLNNAHVRDRLRKRWRRHLRGVAGRPIAH